MTIPDRGRRRIDRVLADNYLDDLRVLPLDELRALRDEADQEETDLSYLRRLLHGRIDLIRAELARRHGTDTREPGPRDPDGQVPSLIASLPDILADERQVPARGRGRHLSAVPSRVGAHRRRVEALVAELGLADLASDPEERLISARALLEAEEREQSVIRRQVQAVVDACTAELTRRYKEGEADVSELLPP